MLVGVLFVTSSAQSQNLRALRNLGKDVFFDKISEPATQSCASCHVPETGFTAPTSLINETTVVVPGADGTSFGNRKPPSAAYAAFAPPFDPACTPATPPFLCRGGIFWDGRATGQTIGVEVFGGDPDLASAYAEFLGPTADQALAPFGSDVEMNCPDGNDNGFPGAEFVCRHVAASSYVVKYVRAWGEEPDCETTGVDISFKRIAVAIAAWEASSQVNPFNSRRDRALANDDDGQFPLRRLNDQENLGHDLFFGVISELNPVGKDAGCALCHNSEGGGSLGDEPEQLYTDHAFHHLGIPPNPDIPTFDPAQPDLGLAHHTSPGDPATSPHAGAFRTPTLRNVARPPNRNFTRAFMHNGYFKSLQQVVHFYNTAIAKPVCPGGIVSAEDAIANDCWPAPETPDPLPGSAFGLFGDLGLTEAEEDALVAYLEALSDRRVASPPGGADDDDDGDDDDDDDDDD